MQRCSIYAALVAILALGDTQAQDAADTFTAPSVPARTIQWAECDATQIDAEAFALGDRLRCGQMSVPLDHHRPDQGSIDIGLVRIRAADAATREGAIFFNPGGPGINPMEYMPIMGLLWNDAKIDDPAHSTKKVLSNRYDLVGVIPRGLFGGTQFQCEIEPGITDYNDVIADRSARNIQTTDRVMRAIAGACRRHPYHPYINTEQTVYDLDLARRSLGEPKLNYYGVSYGTWLGSWYAATYPEHVGRMLLDSSMDWTVSFEANLRNASEASQARFDRLVVQPAAADATYGLGTDADAIVDRVRGLVLRVRDSWASHYQSPESLLAAIATSGWFATTPDLTRAAITARIRHHRFHADDDINEGTRNEAMRMVASYYNPRGIDIAGPAGLFGSVYAAVSCNDTASETDAANSQALIAKHAIDYPATNGDHLQYYCVFWNGPHAIRPALSRIGRAGPILMVQAQYDSITPLQSAAHSMDATPNAKMIIADRFDGHAVFGMSDSVCIEDKIGLFFLTGTVPEDRITHCTVPAVTASPLRGFHDPVRARRWRERMAVFLQRTTPRWGESR